MAQLHSVAAQTRLQAIETQLSLHFTLCEMAQTEVRYGQISEARKLIAKVRHQAAEIRFHINEPKHIPADSKAGLLKQLAQLQTRVDETESLLSNS
jgi:hypothetical protein